MKYEYEGGICCMGISLYDRHNPQCLLEVPCEWCGERFHPEDGEGIGAYCSIECGLSTEGRL